MAPGEGMRLPHREKTEGGIANKSAEPWRRCARDNQRYIDLACLQRGRSRLPGERNGGILIRRHAGFRQEKGRQHAHARALRPDRDASTHNVLQAVHRRGLAMKDPERLVENGAERADALLSEIAGEACLHDAGIRLAGFHARQIVDRPCRLQHIHLDVELAQRLRKALRRRCIGAARRAARNGDALGRRR